MLAARAKWIALGFKLFTAAIVLAALVRAFDVSSRLAQTSDSAQSFVAAHAVASGNVLLSHWHFPVDDYYFTDTLPYAAFEWIAGSRPTFLALIPALTYTLFFVAALFVCVRASRPAKRNIPAVAVLSLLLAAPAQIGIWNPLLLSDMHMATVVGAFAALAICARIAAEKSHILGCISLPLIVALTVASDPFGLIFAYAPAAAMLAVDLFRGSSNPRRALILLLTGIALGLVLPFTIAAAGGFTAENDVATGFIAAPLFGRNLLAALTSVLALSGITSAIEIGWRALFLVIVRIASFAMVITAVANVTWHLFGRAPLFDRLLCAGILVDIAACAASAQFDKGITPQNVFSGGPPMRFLVPVVLFGVALAGRQIPEMLSALRARDALTAMLASIAAASVLVIGWIGDIELQPRWIENNAPGTASHWLETHGLRQGVGEYWSANLITAVSGNKIQIRSVVPIEGRLAPYVWVEDARFYLRTPQFMIWQDANKTDVTMAQVRASFDICRTELIAGYRIAVLGRGSGCVPGRGNPTTGG